MEDAIIIGAGVAGLAAAYASQFQYPIFEATMVPGGLCGGFDIQGFRFDKAVHMSFACDPTVRRVFDLIPHHSYAPYPINWYHDRWINHPIQNNLFALPPEARIQAVKSFVERPSESAPQNFAEWNVSRFGTYISDHFVSPYNKKYWREDLSRLGVDWITGRLYQPSLEEVLFGSFTDKTPNTYYAKEMRYPKNGGYQGFLSGLISQSTIHCNKQVMKIDGGKHTVTFADGTSLPYQKILSSIPLTEMGCIVEDMPDKVRDAIEMLNYTGVATVSVGFRCPAKINAFWFYIYDDDIMAARVHSPTQKAASNVPEGCSSLQFEIYFNHKDTPPTAEASVQNTKMALRRILGDAIEKDILFMDFRIENYGNILMYPDNEQNSTLVKEYLKTISVIPIGRFGEWDYLWSDQAFLSGYKSVLTCT